MVAAHNGRPNVITFFVIKCNIIYYTNVYYKHSVVHHPGDENGLITDLAHTLSNLLAASHRHLPRSDRLRRIGAPGRSIATRVGQFVQSLAWLRERIYEAEDARTLRTPCFTLSSLRLRLSTTKAVQAGEGLSVAVRLSAVQAANANASLLSKVGAVHVIRWRGKCRPHDATNALVAPQRAWRHDTTANNSIFAFTHVLASDVISVAASLTPHTSGRFAHLRHTLNTSGSDLSLSASRPMPADAVWADDTVRADFTAVLQYSMVFEDTLASQTPSARPWVPAGTKEHYCANYTDQKSKCVLNCSRYEPSAGWWFMPHGVGGSIAGAVPAAHQHGCIGVTHAAAARCLKTAGVLILLEQ